MNQQQINDVRKPHELVQKLLQLQSAMKSNQTTHETAAYEPVNLCYQQGQAKPSVIENNFQLINYQSKIKLNENKETIGKLTTLHRLILPTIEVACPNTGQLQPLIFTPPSADEILKKTDFLYNIRNNKFITDDQRLFEMIFSEDKRNSNYGASISTSIDQSPQNIQMQFPESIIESNKNNPDTRQVVQHETTFLPNTSQKKNDADIKLQLHTLLHLEHRVPIFDLDLGQQKRKTQESYSQQKEDALQVLIQSVPQHFDSISNSKNDFEQNQSQGKPPRWKLSAHQSAVLEQAFIDEPHSWSRTQYYKFSVDLDLPLPKLYKWNWDRRLRERNRQPQSQHFKIKEKTLQKKITAAKARYQSLLNKSKASTNNKPEQLKVTD